ncbi:hypothetical protein LINPERPRIM_LOCUS42547 [Linum perenne]
MTSRGVVHKNFCDWWYDMWNTMTLEDFFTLKEMNDGLTIPSRVHELLAVMRKGKDSVVKNIGDATRQWTAVGNTISATENRECLDLFIQLDGLWYFNKWLKDAQDYSKGTSGFTEESIVVLLRAVEKLQIDKARSLSSGICTTVDNLLHHSCSRVQDRARSLLDSWKQDKYSQNARGIDTLDASSDVKTAENIFVEGSDGTKRSAVEISNDEATKSRAMNCSEVERVQNVETCVAHAILDDGNCSDKSVTESVMSNCIQGGTSLKEKISVGILERAASTETRISSVQMGQGAEPETDAINNSSSLCDRASSVASASSKLESEMNSTSDAANVQEIKTDPLKNIEAEGGDKSHSASASDDDGKAAGAAEGATDNMVATIDHSPLIVHSISKDDQCLDVQTGALKTTTEHENKPSSNRDAKVEDGDAFSKSAFDTQSSFSTNKKTSDVELEQVARQVAQEVEIEDQTRGFPEDGLSSSQNQSLKALPDQSSQSPKSNRENLESSQLTEAVREPEAEDKESCGFDLNEEGTSDDADHPTPISVVSVSRLAVAASASPAAPLQFEGTLGWKGSAATSAFHPASALKDTNNVETGTTSINSKQRQQEWLDIDLNISEDGDEKVTGKSERPCLDLNRTTDDREAPFKGERLFFLRSPSPASSSSSLRPSLNSFDLNDPVGKSSSHSLSLNGGGSRQLDPVISIMGAKVEVGSRTEKDFFHQTPFMFLPDCNKPLEPTVDARIGVIGMVPAASSSSSYNVNGLGGTVPYMVDSRGSSMVPQIVGTGPSFFMNMAPGAGPSQAGFDLNGGGSSSSSNGGLRQFFMTRSFEERLRANPQPSTTSGTIRKEPEGGWEPYSLHYKQQKQHHHHHQQEQPPWR